MVTEVILGVQHYSTSPFTENENECESKIVLRLFFDLLTCSLIFPFLKKYFEDISPF